MNTPIIEHHPFEPFVPTHPKILILGSFPGKEQTQAFFPDAWFYGAKRNQFWKILEGVFETPLSNVAQQRELFEEKGIAVTDIILSARRMNNSNLDTNLEIISFNDQAIVALFQRYDFKQLFFTSKFVEKHYKKWRLGPSGTCLPSPSPRYAAMSLQEKIEVYKKYLRP
jgi:hypoxanthine-DNA glycosylase